MSQENLVGIQGAQTIISKLKIPQSSITKLKFNNNSLRDDGVSVLFEFLKSSRHRSTISEIHLNGNDIGSRGLRDIADYVNGNQVLKTLWLANNKLGPDRDALASFATAINNSRLEFLSLTGNCELGDAVVALFFRHLRAPRLQELHINAMGLSARGASGLAEWISGRLSQHDGGVCSLHTLKCSGNNLGMKGVWEVIHAIEVGNWSLTKVEIYANQISVSPFPPPPPPPPPPPAQPSSSQTQTSWGDAERALRKVLDGRNAPWKEQIEKEALNLLKYSRMLILRPSTALLRAEQQAPDRLAEDKSFPFYSLPIELQLQVLAAFAPSLSDAQRARIYEYASDPLTLPPLVPRLQRDKGYRCIADPSRPPLGASVGFTLYTSGGCAEGRCMGAGSLMCRRGAERTKFFEAVGCCFYERQ